MKQLQLFTIIAGLFALILINTTVSGQIKNGKGWKAGVSSMIITPTESIWMAGYGSRDHPSEGTLNDLWIKALALQDAKGHQSVLVTMDLEEIPKVMSDRIRNQLKAKFHLSKSQIILNVSHTHSSPVLENFGDIYSLDSIQKVKIRKYTAELEEKIVALVGKALHSMEPVQLYSGNGVTRFQINRRNNNESTLNLQTEFLLPFFHL